VLALIVAITAGAFSAATAAQEAVLGWEGDSTLGYAFASPAFGLKVSDRASWLLRGAGSYLYYQFPDSTGTTNVRSPGVSGGMAFRFRSQRLTTTIGAGYEIRWDERKFGNGQSGRTVEGGVQAQVDAFFQATPLTNLNVISSYGYANRYSWTRAGVKRQITNKKFTGSHALSLGIEGTDQGNRDLREYAAGGLFELAFLHAHASLQFRAGYTRRRYVGQSYTSRPYLGFGLYRSF